MKTRTPAPLCKPQDNLLLDEDCVQSRRQLGEAVAEAWNSFQSSYGSFADEYSESLIGRATK